jgi:Flp pilus assembly pilin Flp
LSRCCLFRENRVHLSSERTRSVRLIVASFGYQRVATRAQAYWSNRSGAAGIEFALVASVLCMLLLNGIEIAHYAYAAVQVQHAAQVGAQAVWKACDPTKELPATTKCAGMSAAIAAAIRSTSLGDRVVLQANSPSERYYCLGSANALIPTDGIALDAKPADCKTIPGAQAGRPGDYIKVDVTYEYAPIFLDFTVGKFFTGPVTGTTYMRLL